MLEWHFLVSTETGFPQNRLFLHHIVMIVHHNNSHSSISSKHLISLMLAQFVVKDAWNTVSKHPHEVSNTTRPVRDVSPIIP